MRAIAACSESLADRNTCATVPSMLQKSQPQWRRGAAVSPKYLTSAYIRQAELLAKGYLGNGAMTADDVEVCGYTTSTRKLTYKTGQ
jgi:hypothetical protein